jgi:hypothetical protein
LAYFARRKPEKGFAKIKQKRPVFANRKLRVSMFAKIKQNSQDEQIKKRFA